MGRIGRRTARFQVSSRLTWSFSAHVGLGRSRSIVPGPSRPVPAAGRSVTAVLVRSLLRAARPRLAARCARRARRR
ncbi:hypothetical protein [Streptomyces sp. NPDC018610]|uniref:hypothetical protein n=1 Tax=Streptomyces sp. NPDC018610 TaxID=3365049 RepID=UPI0037AE9CBB